MLSQRTLWTTRSGRLCIYNTSLKNYCHTVIWKSRGCGWGKTKNKKKKKKACYLEGTSWIHHSFPQRFTCKHPNSSFHFLVARDPNGMPFHSNHAWVTHAQWKLSVEGIFLWIKIIFEDTGLWNVVRTSWAVGKETDAMGWWDGVAGSPSGGSAWPLLMPQAHAMVGYWGVNLNNFLKGWGRRNLGCASPFRTARHWQETDGAMLCDVD